jgi:hypothetical protein
MIVTEQVPDDSGQVFEENVTFPVPEIFDQVTFPLCDEYPPDTVALQVAFMPIPKDDSVHDTVVTVTAFLMVSLANRELP